MPGLSLSVSVWEWKAETCWDRNAAINNRDQGNLPEVLHSEGLSVSCTRHRQRSLCMRVQVRGHRPAGRWVRDWGSPHRVMAGTFRASLARGFRATADNTIRNAILLVGERSGDVCGLSFGLRDVDGALYFGASLGPPRSGGSGGLGSHGISSWNCFWSCCCSSWAVLLGLALAWIILVHPFRVLWQNRQQDYLLLLGQSTGSTGSLLPEKQSQMTSQFNRWVMRLHWPSMAAQWFIQALATLQLPAFRWQKQNRSM